MRRANDSRKARVCALHSLIHLPAQPRAPYLSLESPTYQPGAAVPQLLSLSLHPLVPFKLHTRNLRFAARSP